MQAGPLRHDYAQFVASSKAAVCGVMNAMRAERQTEQQLEALVHECTSRRAAAAAAGARDEEEVDVLVEAALKDVQQLRADLTARARGPARSRCASAAGVADYRALAKEHGASSDELVARFQSRLSKVNSHLNMQTMQLRSLSREMSQ
ncbi:hypothetical protein DIPPA_08307 [Diplonema papillatum]|nr:hypothetical protein DIPPA_08307 [Diplonema papillatum]